MRLPKASRLKYWDGNEFVAVPNASGLGVEGNRFNVTTFDEITTTKLRLEMDGDGTYSTGILEWRVLDSGKSPDFPPMVSAGVDRDVVLGGKTYLSGAMKFLEAGPDGENFLEQGFRAGRREFADASALKTTATFSKPGDYRSEIDGGRG